MICFLLLKANSFSHIQYSLWFPFFKLTHIIPFPECSLSVYPFFNFILNFIHCANFIIAPITRSYLNGRKRYHRHCRLTRNGTCLLLELKLKNLLHNLPFLNFLLTIQKSLTSSQPIFL